MVDPVTAAATAASAFKVIRAGFSVGRDIEQMAGDLSRWMGALSDLDEAERLAKNPPIFKQLFAGQSAEAEAMQVFAARRKAQEDRDQLRTYIQYTMGASAWNELVATEARIRKERKDTLYKQAERRRKFLEVGAIVLFSVLTLGFFAFLLWLYVEKN
jgi:hypothetical protein